MLIQNFKIPDIDVWCSHHQQRGSFELITRANYNDECTELWSNLY